MNKVFLHVDLDAFFASVEQLDHPEYRGKPVIVGGLPEDRRSVVSTASYEARRFGVHSAMPTFQAVKLCPHGIFVRGRMKRYHEKSEEVMSIFKNYSPDIQQISVDEAFIDLTGTERLFGNPVETAKKIKKEVFEKTGLTVSVGLASTKYCAKIASGLQKPDGLTVVPFGEETDFMLSLPVEKVWGAGNKTLEKLRQYGIKTTRDIYIRSENLLKSLFGNATGTFLYNAVRGNEGLDFHAEPKSRSISAESTYEYDLINSDIIETALLDLCHTVMFRSLREKVRSCTVSLKIRYEDFSTVSVQATSERYVSSLDDLFERAKNLLVKKRDPRLGIRLLGVALQNLEDESIPRQQELFDFGEEKKRRLENAILKAQEKDPNLKITKARLLGTTSILLALFFFPLTKTPAQSGTETEREADGAAGIVFDTSKLPLSDAGVFTSLFNANFGKFGEQNIEFLAEGYWKSTVTGGMTGSFGFGTSPILSTSSPVFTQNVDLSLYFLLNQHWYFEAAFADEFSKNTVGAGYIGEGYLKSARISNRKIIFPSIYSVDDVNRGIGGGENQAAGLSLNWAGKNWQADAAIRYDLLEAHEKTWYGKNSVQIKEIALSSYNTGNQYILPDENLIQNIKAIYVESSSGTYKDTKGRKFKKLDESQYLLMASEKQILLSKDARAFKQDGVLPSVAVTFWKDVRQSDFADYFSKLQQWFGENQNGKLNIEKYFYQLFNSIDGEDCLFLQHPSGFSPFGMANRYDCASSSASDAQIAFSSNGTTDSFYSAVIDEDNLRLAQTDFFYSNHLYADIFLSDDDSSDKTEKLIHQAFPLASKHPEVYLGSSSSSLTGEVLQLRSFSPVNRFEIGTNAVSGGITVWKNGIIDSGAKYDSESGTITLSSAVAETDRITVQWYEESEDSDSAQISAAAGFKYDFTDNLYGDISTSVRWSDSKDLEFADSSNRQTGFATLASKLSYENNYFSATNTVAATYENLNTTGQYRILGNDDSESGTSYLSKKAGVDLPEGFAPVLNEKSSGSISSIELNPSQNGSVEAQDGISDSEISGYALPFEWNFNSLEDGNDENMHWSALTLYTPSLSPELLNASTFSIAIKNPDYIANFDSSKCALYLQLGVSSDDDFSIEESAKIPTWKISDSLSEGIRKYFDFSKSGWQTVTVALTDEDRSVISSLQNFNARLILTAFDSSSLPKTGTLYAGPYEAGELVFSSSSDADVVTSNYQTLDSSLSSAKITAFNKQKSSDSKNYVQYFDWHFNSAPSESCKITFSRYFSEIDLSEYKKLSFFLKSENAESIKISLCRPKNGLTENSIIYEINSPSSSWKEYSIDLSENTDSSLVTCSPGIIPTRIEITVTTKENGTLSFDELYLSENTPYLAFQDKIETGCNINGSIIQAGSYDILKDFKIKADGNGSTAIESETGKSKDKSLQSSGMLSFTLTNLKFYGTVSLSNAYLNASSSDVNQKNALDSASHSISNEKSLLGLFSFTENYNFSAAEESLQKSNSVKIDFSSLSVPLELSAETKARSDSWSQNQNGKTSLNFKTNRFKLESEAKIAQTIPVISSSYSDSTLNKKEKLAAENYFSSWKSITDLAFDSGDEKATKRLVGTSSTISCHFDALSFNPKITFESEGNYKASSANTFTDTTKAGFELPFSLLKNNFSFSWKKSSGSTQNVSKGGSYTQDSVELQKSLREKSYFLKAVPLYDLLNKNLSVQVFETDRESNFYTGLYTFSWKRSFFGNKYDFFIPNSAKLEAARDIRSGTSTSDFYQIKNTVNYTALNIFGKNGTLPLTSLFSNDEYNSSLSAAVKIPRADTSSLSYLFGGYFQSTFYFTPQNYLKNGLEGSIEGSGNSGDFKAKYTLVWKRNSNTSLAKGITEIFIDKKALKIERIRKADSLNFSMSSTSSLSQKSTKKYNLAWTHSTETQVSRFVSINTDAGLSYYANWGKIATLTANASLGATIKF